MSRSRRGAALAALAILAATGCGGGADAGGKSTTSQRPNANDQMLEYTRCMRTQGVQMPDPGDEDAPLPKPDSNPVVAAAHAQCRKHLPAKMQDGPAGPAEHDRLVALAQCLRRHDVNVPDPQPGQDLALPAGSSRNQRVQDALAECGKAKGGK